LMLLEVTHTTNIKGLVMPSFLRSLIRLEIDSGKKKRNKEIE